jgi:hypothetical protein
MSIPVETRISGIRSTQFILLVLENSVWCILGEDRKRGFYRKYKYLNNQAVYEQIASVV